MAEEKVIPAESGTAEEQIVDGFLQSVINDIIYSPLNLVLVGLITFLVYKILRSRQQPVAPPPEPELPRLRKDFTVAELQPFNGTQPDGRILVAVNGSVYDVTKGKRFYGPGGPYAAFGGRDASRCLATFSVVCSEKLEYDDLSDLSAMEMESVLEWEAQFKDRYILVGRLLKPGEQPTNYSDEDEDTPNEATPTAAEPAKAAAAAAPADKTETAAPVPASPKRESKPVTPAEDAHAAAPSKVEDVVVNPGGDAKAKDE